MDEGLQDSGQFVALYMGYRVRGMQYLRVGCRIGDIRRGDAIVGERFPLRIAQNTLCQFKVTHPWLQHARKAHPALRVLRSEAEQDVTSVSYAYVHRTKRIKGRLLHVAKFVSELCVVGFKGDC